MSYTSYFGSSTTASGTGINYATNTPWSSRLSLGGNTSGALIGGSIDTRAIAHVYEANVFTRIAGNCTAAVTRISLNDSDITMTAGSRVFSSSQYSPSTSLSGAISVNTTIYNASAASRTGMYAGFVNRDISSRSNIGYYTGAGASDSPIPPSGTGIGSLNNVYRNGTSITTAGSIWGGITWGTVPAAPSGFSSTSTSNSVTLNWTNSPGDSGGGTVNGWRVLYAVSGSGVWNTTGKLSGNLYTTSLTVSGLSSSTTYVFRVAALNEVTDTINGSSYSSVAAITGTSSGQITATTTAGLTMSFNDAYSVVTGDTISGRLEYTNNTGSNVTVTIQSSLTSPVSTTSVTLYTGTSYATWSLTGLAPSTSYTIVAKIGSEIYASLSKTTLVAGSLFNYVHTTSYNSITIKIDYVNNMSTSLVVDSYAITGGSGVVDSQTANANSSGTLTSTVTGLYPNTSYTIRSRFQSYTSIYDQIIYSTDVFPVTYTFNPANVSATGDTVYGYVDIVNTSSETVSSAVFANKIGTVGGQYYYFTVTAYQNSTIPFTVTGLDPNSGYDVYVGDLNSYAADDDSVNTLVAGSLTNTYVSSTSSSITVDVGWVNNMSYPLTLEVDDTTGVGTLQSYTLPANSSGTQAATVPDLLPSTTYTIRARIPTIVSVNSTGTTTAAPTRTWRVWTGSAWSTGSANAVVKYWDGTQWSLVSSTKVWDGTQWV